MVEGDAVGEDRGHRKGIMDENTTYDLKCRPQCKYFSTSAPHNRLVQPTLQPGMDGSFHGACTYSIISLFQIKPTVSSPNYSVTPHPRGMVRGTAWEVKSRSGYLTLREVSFIFEAAKQARRNFIDFCMYIFLCSYR